MKKRVSGKCTELVRRKRQRSQRSFLTPAVFGFACLPSDCEAGFLGGALRWHQGVLEEAGLQVSVSAAIIGKALRKQRGPHPLPTPPLGQVTRHLPEPQFPIQSQNPSICSVHLPEVSEKALCELCGCHKPGTNNGSASQVDIVFV